MSAGPIVVISSYVGWFEAGRFVIFREGTKDICSQIGGMARIFHPIIEEIAEDVNLHLLLLRVLDESDEGVPNLPVPFGGMAANVDIGKKEMGHLSVDPKVLRDRVFRARVR